jgi:TonB-linked SusC/RagA family outer membrane protein
MAKNVQRKHAQRSIFLYGVLALLLTASSAWAQRTVTGKIVSNEDQLPIPGVNILVKGTSNGTITDANGNFSMPVNSDNDMLIFSFVGFETMEASVGSRTDFSIELKPDATQLSEVVVTALGIEKDKGKIGYATQEVKGSELVRAREPNPINSLVGKVAGLNIGSSPEILGAPVISLRGKTPLFVVDGVPIQSDTWNLSPDDIESYTVLKGPTASALYGSRGIDGAIIITTKRGTRDKRGFNVEVNSSNMVENGFLTIPKVQDQYGPGDHGRYAFGDGRGAGLYDSDYDIWGPPFEGQLIPQYDGEVSATETFTTTFPSGTSYTGNIRPTPWVARGKDNLERFLEPGFLSTNNVAVSASGDKYDLRFSYTHSYQKGQVPNTKLNSDNFNVSTGFDFSDKLRFESNLNYNRQYTPNTPDVVYGPNSMIYNIIIWGGADWSMDDMKNYWQEGKEGVQQIYADYTRYNNPYFLAYEWLRGHYKSDIYGHMALKYNPVKDIEIMGRTQVTTYNVFRNEKFPYSATTYGREQAKGDYREDNRELFENNTDLLITYNKEISSKFGITASLGGNLRNMNYRSSYVTTDYLSVPASSLNPGGYTFSNSLNPVKSYNFNGKTAVYSGYYTFDVNFNNWLNLNTTGRWDKSSTLPQATNVYFFPSANLSAVISKAVQLPSVISYFKVRAGYANVKSGNTTARIGPIPTPSNLTGNPLGYGSTYTTPYDGDRYSNSAAYSTPLTFGTQLGGYFPNVLTNPNLDPYETSAREVGLDIRFIQNRIGLDVNYFNNIDGPQISNLKLSESTGYTGAIVNGRKTQRKGFEITLTSTPISNNDGLSWNVLVNWSTFRETLKETPDGKADGFINIGDRVDKYYAGAFFKTPDGQLINDAGGRPIRNPIAQYLGNVNPDWTWGINNRVNYKNWSMIFQFDGRVGGEIVNYIQRQTFRGGRHIETVQGAMGEARYQDYLGVKSWVGEGVVVSNGVPIEYDPKTGAITNYDELQFVSNTTPTFLQDYISRYYQAEEFNIMSRSFAKLREVTLTYNVPSSILDRTFIRTAAVSIVGRNLLYFAEKKDMDIDQFAGTNSYAELQSPTLRRYGVNVNLTF